MFLWRNFCDWHENTEEFRAFDIEISENEMKTTVKKFKEFFSWNFWSWKNLIDKEFLFDGKFS